MATWWSAHFSAGCSGENRRSTENGVGQRKRWLTRRGADALWSSCALNSKSLQSAGPYSCTHAYSAYIAYHHGPIEVSNDLLPNARLRNCLSDRPLGLNAFKPGPLRCFFSSVIIMKFGTFAAPKVPNPRNLLLKNTISDDLKTIFAKALHILKLGFPVASLFRPVFNGRFSVFPSDQNWFIDSEMWVLFEVGLVSNVFFFASSHEQNFHRFQVQEAHPKPTQKNKDLWPETPLWNWLRMSRFQSMEQPLGWSRVRLF